MEKTVWRMSFLFLVGVMCGFILQRIINNSIEKTSHTSRVLVEDSSCQKNAFSTLSGQKVYSFMTEEFEKATSPQSDKVIKHHYELMYAPFLSRYYHTPLRIMEIGVERGNSIQLWCRLFPRVSQVYGVGYGFGVKNTEPKHNLDDKTTLYYADQSNISQLQYIINDIGKYSLDVIIDDGSHIPWHQVLSFDILFRELLAPGGTYIIEDIETSYWSSARAELYQYKIPNAGVGKHGSVVERFKSIIDVINRKFIGKPDFSVIGNMKTDHLISSISFSRNCIIIEKMNPADGWTKKNLKTKVYKNFGYISHSEADMFVKEKEKPISGLPPVGQ